MDDSLQITHAKSSVILVLGLLQILALVVGYAADKVIRRRGLRCQWLAIALTVLLFVFVSVLTWMLK